MIRSDFGSNFIWGTATASYQIEGAATEDGKGESIWDRFSHKKGKIARNENGDVACDHYHKIDQDLDLLVGLGIKNYRFSLAWTRILPEGTGRVEQRGIDFYNRLIDGCIKRGISPWVTLYHWDLPQALEDKGGWTSRLVLDAFAEYVSLCVKSFGDRVKNWMILNEPLVFTAAGYLVGAHAPGKRGLKSFLAAAHHASLAQSLGGRLVREYCTGANIGTTFSTSHIDTHKESKRHENAAKRFDAAINRLFVEAAIGRGYPKEVLPFLNKIDKHFHADDEKNLKFDFDFIGVQNYTREVIRFSLLRPYVWANFVPAKKRKVPVTEMGWEVYPESLYQILKKFAAYPEIKKLYVTENGAAFADTISGDSVHDPRRVDYLQSYIGQVLRAKREGVPVEGYFIWSFLDNFEWAEGYRPRFGIVYVDYPTSRRIPKDSGKWYRDFLKG